MSLMSNRGPKSPTSRHRTPYEHVWHQCEGERKSLSISLFRVSSLVLLSIGVLTACSEGEQFANKTDSSTRTEANLMSGADALMEDVGIQCQLHSDGGGQVTMTLENLGASKIEVLKRGTAWDHQSNVFDVRSESSIEYLGIIAFRGPATDDEYIVIEPGEAVSTEYRLTSGYAIEEQGDYSVSLRQPRLVARLDGTPLVVQETCGTLVSHFEPIGGRAGEVSSKSMPLNYHDSSCTSGEKTEIEGAETIARRATQLAKHILSTRSEHLQIFTEWFGTDEDNVMSNVIYVLDEIEDRWTQYDGDCHNECPLGAFAWTQGGDDVHICGAFFSLTSTSVEADAKVQTLVHEKAHLEGLAGGIAIEDIVHSACGGGCYGAAAARNLAEADVAKAVRNAENYERFVSHIYQAAVLAPVLATSAIF